MPCRMCGVTTSKVYLQNCVRLELSCGKSLGFPATSKGVWLNIDSEDIRHACNAARFGGRANELADPLRMRLVRTQNALVLIRA